MSEGRDRKQRGGRRWRCASALWRRRLQRGERERRERRACEMRRDDVEDRRSDSLVGRFLMARGGGARDGWWRAGRERVVGS